MLDGEYDAGDAMMTTVSRWRRWPGFAGLGADALPACICAWAENRGYTVKLIDELPDQEAGIKSVTISVSGDYAYGYLKGEQGVHRLVRISLDWQSAAIRLASGRGHAGVWESVEIEIRPRENLKMDTFRSSGAGASPAT